MKRTATIPGIIILTMATLAQPVPPPTVITSTNRVLTSEERKNVEFEKARKEAEEAYQKKLADAKEKWKAATNRLGNRHHIPAKNPFRLIKPEISKPQVRIVRTVTVGVPHLAGIVKINGSARALLRINQLRGGPAHKFIEVGEIVDGVEVLRIDLKRSIVEVKIKNKTFALEFEKTTTLGRANPSSGTPPRGSSSSSRGTTSDREERMAEWRKKQEEARKAGGSRTSPQRPSGSSKGGLKGVPRRRGGS